jgi:hypothetical protein
MRLRSLAWASVVVAAAAGACTKFTESDPAVLGAEAGADASSDGVVSGDAPPTDEGGILGDAPTDAPPLGTRVIFLTSTQYTGNLGGITGADAKCAAVAKASMRPALVGRIFGAWLSTSGSPVDSRFKKDNRPVVSTLNESLAPGGWVELASATHGSEILLDENGALVTAPFLAWTGTQPDGSFADVSGSNACSDWTSTSGLGVTGDGSAANGAWTQDGTTGCLTPARLYCLER